MTQQATVDEAVDAIGDMYWDTFYRAVERKDVDAIYDAAITLKALEAARKSMKDKFNEY